MWRYAPIAPFAVVAASNRAVLVCGPKGMEAAVTKTLHDAFRKTLDDPAVLATFDKFDQSVIYMNTEAYTRWARETFEAEKATIERLGLTAKS